MEEDILPLPPKNWKCKSCEFNNTCKLSAY